MKPINSSLLLVSAIVGLLPLGALADPQLSTSLHVTSCWEDSSITTGQCQDYNNPQAAPPGTSLSDSGSNSEAPWGRADGSVQVFYGSCHMDGSGVAISSQGDQILGNGGDSAFASWNSQMTINSPGMEGQQATVRITFHGSGDAAGNGSSYLAGFSVGYSYFVGDYQNGVSYGGNWDTNGWTGDGPPTRTFTFDATCTIGQPCEITHQVSFSVSAGTGEPDFGDAMDVNAQAIGSLTFSSGSVEVLDPTNDNQPISFTTVSDVGCGAGQVTPAGAPYAGFSVTNCAQDRLGSTFSLLDGTASQNTNVTANFVAPPEIKAASDVVDLKGTDGDLQVVQIDWDPPRLNFLGPLGYLEVAFLPLGGHGHWESAVLGNYQGPQPTAVGDRPYNPATDFHLGYFGLDSAHHKVWAVINHNSLFAAAIPFDLVSVVSRKTHGAAGTFDVNLPLTGRGVESRSPDASGNHTLVFTFKSNLASGEVSVTNGPGSVSGTPAMSGNTMTVNLTGVTNRQVTTVTLHSMKDVADQVLPDTSINVGFLLGDANGDAVVNSGDATVARNSSGQAANANNFRADFNLDGVINAADATIARNNSGSALPATLPARIDAVKKITR